MSRLALLAGAVLAATPVAAVAAPQPEPFRLVSPNEQPALRADRAYLMMRLEKPAYAGWQNAIFLKVPSPAELAGYEAAKRAAFAKAGRKAGAYEQFQFDYRGAPNLFAAIPKRAFATLGTQAVVLAEVPPGDYVFYGYGFAKFVSACWCFGTVGFSAAPGKITDVGTIFIDRADKPSPFPELATETNLGPTAAMDFVLWSGALRPPRAGDAVPAALAGAPRTGATFHAVGPWVDPNVMYANRLAPIPGVLRYDEGRVINVPTGKEMSPR